MSEQFKPLKIGEVDSDGKFTPVSRDDLSALPEDVRGALDALYIYRFNNEGFNAACKIICAELLRLITMEHAWKQWIKDGMRVKFPLPEPPK